MDPSEPWRLRFVGLGEDPGHEDAVLARRYVERMLIRLAKERPLEAELVDEYFFRPGATLESLAKPRKVMLETIRLRLARAERRIIRWTHTDREPPEHLRLRLERS